MLKSIQPLIAVSTVFALFGCFTETGDTELEPQAEVSSSSATTTTTVSLNQEMSSDEINLFLDMPFYFYDEPVNQVVGPTDTWEVSSVLRGMGLGGPPTSTGCSVNESASALCLLCSFSCLVLSLLPALLP